MHAVRGPVSRTPPSVLASDALSVCTPVSVVPVSGARVVSVREASLTLASSPPSSPPVKRESSSPLLQAKAASTSETAYPTARAWRVLIASLRELGLALPHATDPRWYAPRSRG